MTSLLPDGHHQIEKRKNNNSRKRPIKYRATKRPESERRFQCDQCESRFFTQKDVKRHMVVHTGVRNFPCPFCKQRFGRKDHLVRHAKKSHDQDTRSCKRRNADNLSAQTTATPTSSSSTPATSSTMVKKSAKKTSIVKKTSKPKQRNNYQTQPNYSTASISTSSSSSSTTINNLQVNVIYFNNRDSTTSSSTSSPYGTRSNDNNSAINMLTHSTSTTPTGSLPSSTMLASKIIYDDIGGVDSATTPSYTITQRNYSNSVNFDNNYSQQYCSQQDYTQLDFNPGTISNTTTAATAIDNYSIDHHHHDGSAGAQCFPISLQQSQLKSSTSTFSPDFSINQTESTPFCLPSFSSQQTTSLRDSRTHPPPPPLLSPRPHHQLQSHPQQQHHHSSNQSTGQIKSGFMMTPTSTFNFNPIGESIYNQPQQQTPTQISLNNFPSTSNPIQSLIDETSQEHYHHPQAHHHHHHHLRQHHHHRDTSFDSI
ncbi:hypothetical protein BLA29_003506 [Euroglyphus maynei]|uniref:C2H2-type domain-containing protein n=1 Tax=Euroglyphus maynei TaxID=6958 RepID=A0A1Y3B189_EURMA|nr:hypothetical protein BLA29_003506 [Euroglyphus maynei]